MGEDTGYDSGSTLDFVYRNQPESTSILGKLIDRKYLNAIGWRGIRIRKQHIEQLLIQYAEKLNQSGKPLRLLDIAAGHGRYILDAIQNLSVRPAHVLLRDYSPLNVNAGNALIRSRGLDDIAVFKQGDAFDEASLASIEPKITLAVVSGLYELFSDNDLLRQSLRGLSQAIEKKATLFTPVRSGILNKNLLLVHSPHTVRRCLGDAFTFSSRN